MEQKASAATPIEEIIRRLIKRILTDCRDEGVEVSETLAAFTIKSVVLNRRHANLLEHIRSVTDGGEIVRLCVERLVDLRSPAAELIRMQVFFETSYMSREDILEDHGQTLQARLAPVVDDILTVTASKGDRDELELLYRKVVVFTILAHSLGDPVNDAVEREASAALHSVFPPAELGNFLALPPAEKKMQLGELADIVAGVRLFNQDAGKGGVGIEDVPGLLERAVSATRAVVDEELQHCSSMSAKYNAIIRLYAKRSVAALKYTYQERTDDVDDDDPNVPKSVLKRGLADLIADNTEENSDEDAESDVDESTSRNSEVDEEGESLSLQFVRLCCEIVAHYRQYELYLRIIIGDIGKVAAQLIQLQEEMAGLLKRLHKLIDASPAVPANLVLPLFVELADAWRGYQVETVCLSMLNTLHTQLQQYMKLYDTQEVLPETWLNERLNGLEVITDAEQVEQNKEHKYEPKKGTVALVLPVERLMNYSQLPVRYNRICPHALVVGGGQLLVGDPGIGVAFYAGRYYQCSSTRALRAFAKNPNYYIRAVEERGRRHPELIHLLSMEEVFAAGDTPLAPEPRLTTDQAVQTELHPQPAAADDDDPDFSWNEWTMRRRALLLADLRSRRTCAAQTERSHLRRDNATQVFGPVGVGTQTRRDAYSKVPQPMKFIHGLRGRPDAAQGTVDLTPSVFDA